MAPLSRCPDMATTTTTARSGGTANELRANELRAKREALGWTRATLAARVGCSIAHLANIEAGAIPQASPVLARIEFELKNDDGLAANEPVGTSEAADARPCVEA